MPLLDHLRELRQRVLRSAIAVLLAFGGGWYFYNPIISTLAKPVCDLKAAQESGAASCGALYISGVLGPLDLQIKVALLTPAFIASSVNALLFTSIEGKVILSSIVRPIKKGKFVEIV